MTIGRSMWTLGTEAASQSPGFAWTMAGTMVVLAATCWWSLRRASSDTDAANIKSAAAQAALDKALTRIKGFSESQGRLVGNMAQEIKAPLATVLIHAGVLLASSEEPANVQSHAKSIAADVQHVSDVVESILRVALPRAQEDTSRHVPVHFHDIVLEAVRRCRSLAATRSVSVVPMLAESRNGASVEVLGDAVLLQAMIENLVRNAVLSAPRGTRVDLHVKIEGEEIVLAVRDQGAKMDEDKLDSFDALFEVATPERPTAGSGLSFAIAKRVAEHHRGTISLRNVPTGGCEFEIQLPRWRSDGALAAPAPTQVVPRWPERAYRAPRGHQGFGRLA